MRPHLSLAAALVLPVIPAAAAGDGAAIIRIAAAPARPGWFVCDGIDGAFAAFFGARDAKGRSVVTLMDRDAGRLTTGGIDVGTGDAGAGQIVYPISRGGRAIGQVHMVNPGMVGDPVLPAVTGVDLDGHRLECRLMPDMRFLGVAPTRSVMVRGRGAGVIYESFDYRGRGAVTHPDGVHRSNVPSLAIPGKPGPRAGGFRFDTRGFRYLVSVNPDAGSVRAIRGGHIVAIDRFVGSSSVPPRAVATDAYRLEVAGHRMAKRVETVR